jgi:hypothetical protein
MSSRFVARLPDGTESGFAWFLWMFGTLFFVGTVLFLCNWAVETVLSPLLGHVPHPVYVVAEALLMGVVIALTLRSLGSIATRRLLMPSQVWFVVAGMLVVSWLIVFSEVAAGGFGPAVLGLGSTSGIVVAWRADLRRRRLAEQALPADSAPVELHSGDDASPAPRS